MDVFQEMLSALASEDSVILATILSASGSTPASAFSKMLIKEGGKSWVGTVGGGCMEGDVLHAARELIGREEARVLTFHLNEDDMVQGLICGGSLDILIEPVTRQHVPFIKEIKALRDEGEDGIVATAIDKSGRVVLKRLIRVVHDTNDMVDEWKSLLSNSSSIHVSNQDLAEETRKAHHRNETRRIRLAEGELILEPLGGRPQLIIFGGGHVSKSICRAASMAGFRVTVIDDRKEYANPERFPEAALTVAVHFGDAFTHLTITSSTFIVIVTRGHRSDEEILELALKTQPKYIGMIGSRRKILTTYEHLVDRGVGVDQLQRVQAPMGVEIGAVTAEEIGISVVAQLIQIRRGSPYPLHHKSSVMSELFGQLRLRQSARQG